MKILSISNRKGGVGKSTWTQFTATRLFHALYEKKLKIALIEFDDQGSITNSRKRDLNKPEVISEMKSYYLNDYKERLKNLYPIYTYTYKEYLDKKEKLAEHFEYIFLDFPGVMDIKQTEIIEGIDKVAIPVLADEYDIESSMSYMKALDSKRVKCGWFLNKYTNTRFSKYIKSEGHKGFVKNANPNLEMITYSEGSNKDELMVINERKELIRSSRSSIIPFDDREGHVKNLMMYLIN